MSSEGATTAISMWGARRRLRQLRADLTTITQQDQEQELQGWALPAVDALVGELRALLPDDPVIARLHDVVSPEAVEDGAVRAVDLLVVVGQAYAAIPPPQTSMLGSLLRKPDAPLGG